MTRPPKPRFAGSYKRNRVKMLRELGCPEHLIERAEATVREFCVPQWSNGRWAAMMPFTPFFVQMAIDSAIKVHGASPLRLVR